MNIMRKTYCRGLPLTIQNGGIVVDTTPVVNTTVGDYSFIRKEQDTGAAIEAINVRVYNLDADTDLYVKINGGVSAVVTAINYDYKIPFRVSTENLPNWVDLGLEAMAILNFSIFFPTGHAGVTAGTHYHVIGYDPSRHVH